MTAIALDLPASPGLQTVADRRWPIETLWSAELPSEWPARGGSLPDALRDRVAGRLEIQLRNDRPTVIANFVSTLDGVVALDRVGATGGREISGGFEPDRFLIGLLRATADAVLVGAGTAHASGSKIWTPGGVHPGSAAAFAEWRRLLGLPTAGPTTVIVTGSGSLDLARLGDDGVGVLIVTTTNGSRRLGSAQRPDHVEIVAVAGGERVPIEMVLAILRDRGYQLVVSEAGPTLFGELLGARAVDELFLTVAPQVAGRSDEVERLALVEGAAFGPSAAPWARLWSVMRSADHLFLRYDLRSDRKEAS
ncbi:MAG TPA: dihydrofolate reductase family protein [Candidatus Limnocylindrales bacterium]|jgi:riboflavin biosynthesis pyrimidine reductase|nr:dihydrofolate reductase family protein [Candidatus Limnocylindrales bacterium]